MGLNSLRIQLSLTGSSLRPTHSLPLWAARMGLESTRIQLSCAAVHSAQAIPISAANNRSGFPVLVGVNAIGLDSLLFSLFVLCLYSTHLPLTGRFYDGDFPVFAVVIQLNVHFLFKRISKLTHAHCDIAQDIDASQLELLRRPSAAGVAVLSSNIRCRVEPNQSLLSFLRTHITFRSIVPLHSPAKYTCLPAHAPYLCSISDKHP